MNEYVIYSSFYPHYHISSLYVCLSSQRPRVKSAARSHWLSNCWNLPPTPETFFVQPIVFWTLTVFFILGELYHVVSSFSVFP